VSKEDSIYKEAMQCIDELVEEVIQRCYDVAEQNHFENEWVLEQFRNTFNKVKNKRNM